MTEQQIAELIRLTRFSFAQGDYERCIAWAKQCESLARREKQLEYELWAIAEQAIAWANVGNASQSLDAATHLMNRARQSHQEGWFLLGTRLFVGRMAVIDLRNRWDAIRTLLLEGVERARQLKHKREEIDHLRLLGEYAIKVGEWEAGDAWLQEALSLIPPSLEQAHFFHFVIYQSLSRLLEKQNDPGEAVRYARMAMGAADLDGNPSFVADARLRLAAAEQACGNLGAALTIAEEVLPLAVARGWKVEEREAHALLAKLRLALGHLAEALPHAERAVELAVAQAQQEEEVEGYLLLGQVQHALGQPEARATLQRARDLAEERRYETLRQKADSLFASLS